MNIKKYILVALSMFLMGAHVFTHAAHVIGEQSTKKNVHSIQRLEELFEKTEAKDGKAEIRVNDFIEYNKNTFIIIAINPEYSSVDRLINTEITLRYAQPSFIQRAIGDTFSVEAQRYVDEAEWKIVRTHCKTNLAYMNPTTYKALLISMFMGALVCYNAWS